MSETNHPNGDGGSQGHPGSGLPGYGQGQDGHAPYGYEESLPASSPSARPFGSIPAGPATGAPAATPSGWASSVPLDSASPPTSASSTAPGPRTPSAPSAPSGGQSTPTLSATQAGAALRRLGIGNPLPTFVGGALAYGVALGAALLVILSAVLAMLTLDTGDLAGGTPDPAGGATSPSGVDGWRVIVGLVGIPLQLVSLASFGSYGVELNLGFLGTAIMGWRGLPLLITVAMVATAFFIARFAQRRWGAGRWGSNGALGALLCGRDDHAGS